jgi:hypothetical protein
MREKERVDGRKRREREREREREERKMRNTEALAYNCPLSWWKLSTHRFKN